MPQPHQSYGAGPAATQVILPTWGMRMFLENTIWRTRVRGQDCICLEEWLLLLSESAVSVQLCVTL